jgi:hypothetical protein
MIFPAQQHYKSFYKIHKKNSCVRYVMIMAATATIWITTNSMVTSNDGICWQDFDDIRELLLPSQSVRCKWYW